MELKTAYKNIRTVYPKMSSKIALNQARAACKDKDAFEKVFGKARYKEVQTGKHHTEQNFEHF